MIPLPTDSITYAVPSADRLSKSAVTKTVAAKISLPANIAETSDISVPNLFCEIGATGRTARLQIRTRQALPS